MEAVLSARFFLNKMPVMGEFPVDRMGNRAYIHRWMIGVMSAVLPYTTNNKVSLKSSQKTSNKRNS